MTKRRPSRERIPYAGVPDESLERARFRGGSLDSRRGLPCVRRALHRRNQPSRICFIGARPARADPQIDRLVARPDYACRDHQGGGTHRSDTGRCFVEICWRSRGRCGAGDKVAVGQVIARLRSPELEAQLQAAQSDLRSAKEAQAQDAIKAAEAKVEQIKSMISGLTLVSPREGKVQYQLAQAGDSVAAGAPIVTLIDLADVYMSVFLRAADAGKLALGGEARLILDEAPDYVVPAAVSFVAPNAQSAPKGGEIKDDPAKQLLRVDLKIDPKVVETYYGKVEIELRGAGFVRTRPDAKWPAELQVKLPPAPVAQEAATASASIGGASAPSAPAAASRSAGVPEPAANAP